MKKSKVVVILGPTASGKSDLAVEIAEKIDGEIISADSRQIYKELNLTSGKITPEEMRGVPHYMLDVISLRTRQVYSAEKFQRQAGKIINEIITRKKLPIICGGTGFYIDSLLYNQKFPKVAPDKKLREELEKYSTEKLFERLKKLDPERAQNIDSNNRHRLMRSIEIATALGKVPEIKKEKRFETLKIGINWPKEDLQKRIEKRLEKRLRAGMIEEVEKIHKSGIGFKKLEELGLEPKYISLYLEGKISKEEMKKNICRDSIQYAKRQMTWFKRDKNIYWIKDRKGAFKLVKKFYNVR